MCADMAMTVAQGRERRTPLWAIGAAALLSGRKIVAFLERPTGRQSRICYAIVYRGARVLSARHSSLRRRLHRVGLWHRRFVAAWNKNRQWYTARRQRVDGSTQIVAVRF